VYSASGLIFSFSICVFQDLFSFSWPLKKTITLQALQLLSLNTLPFYFKKYLLCLLVDCKWSYVNMILAFTKVPLYKFIFLHFHGASLQSLPKETHT